MGSSTNNKLEYGKYVGEEKPGQTRIIRNPECPDSDIFEIDLEYETIWDAFTATVKTNGLRNFIGSRERLKVNEKGITLYGDYVFKTYEEVYSEVVALRNSLIENNFCKTIKTDQGEFKFLGIYCKNREEWIVSDLASHSHSITIVTLYDTLGDNAIEYILTETKVSTLIIEDLKLEKIIQLKRENKCKDLVNLILLDGISEENAKQCKEANLNLFDYVGLLESGKNKSHPYNPCNTKTIASLCYTSGTTNIPKGAIISHRNICANIHCFLNTKGEFISAQNTDVHISYLPLAHVMERLFIYSTMMAGGRIGFASNNLTNLVEDMQKLKPTIFLGVPRVYMRIFELLREKFYNLNYMQKSLVDRALSTKLSSYTSTGQVSSMIWDNLIFGNMKDTLGGHVRLMVTGSAPIDPSILDFLKVCFSCPVIEGYGQTETTGPTTITRLSDHNGGSVGGPLINTEIKLIDVPELKYFSTDKDEHGEPAPRGEVCVRGPIVFNGYFNNAESNKNVFDSEGWLHTGDIAQILPHLGIKIIDRVKNIFKLSHGEYVAPEKIENILINSKYINQIFVHGSSLEDYLIAVVVPNIENVTKLIKEYYPDASTMKNENLLYYLNKDVVKKEVLKDIEEISRKEGLKGFEVVKKIHFDLEPFTIEKEMLTPTHKLVRKNLRDKYTTALTKLYEEDLI